jgi:predicted deacylase
VIERRTIRFEHEPLVGLEHPCFVASGAKDGPRLVLLGGIHGCEYSSIAAVIRFMNTLETSELAGTITALPVASMQSFRARTPFVVPQDGKNLNRCFPGSYEGSYAEVLARSIFDELIAPADALVDLHGGDMVEALQPFTLYDESRVEGPARAMAVAFGLPYVVRQSAPGAAPSGMTCSAAAAAGVPGIIAEAGGCGLLDEGAVGLLTTGVENVLRQLGMLPGEPEPALCPLQSVGRFLWLRSANEGWWDAAVKAGEEVVTSSVLGRVRNLYGDVLEEIHAPDDGVILFVTTSPAVSADGLLLGLGVDLEPVPARGGPA